MLEMRCRKILSIVVLGSLFLASSIAVAAQTELDIYLKADIDWKQCEGETINVLVTPAHYFNKFRAITPGFTKLTGVKVTFDVIPPREMREKAVLDFAMGTGTYVAHTADPMYIPLYVVNNWVEPLDEYLNNSTLTDLEWFDLEDIIPLWREADSVKGKLYGMPVEGEATVHIYRTDIYDQFGLTVPETFEELRMTAQKTHQPEKNLAGLVLRGFRGAGQNMYIWPSLFRSWGGEWFDATARPAVNSKAGIGALEYYADVLQHWSAPGVENWNWPEIMEAFAAGTVVQYIDANSTASVIEDPDKSKVAGRIGYHRWPIGPAGRRVTSIWNWTTPINSEISERKKKATWLYIQWLASRPTQFRSALYKESPEAVIRTGVNRVSIWQDPEYQKLVGFQGGNFIEVVLTSLREDTDADWRPRVSEWPQIGEAMAIAIQAALVGEKTPKQALDEANARIIEIMK